MGQLGFFDADKRLEALSSPPSARSHRSSRAVGELSRFEVEAVVLTSDELKKSSSLSGSRSHARRTP